ncbi:arylesterase [Gramella sp. AN32]|uniref:Arylesterase n=1 Tax=Christiangramia antarctica TaxID=2058158 RepID=A0ABW5X0R0_9FLAO|nr:arylesterase [Gramella sp. AN32]MCM4157065.1 arylesterase [Gramella sp. AN32]
MRTALQYIIVCSLILFTSCKNSSEGNTPEKNAQDSRIEETVAEGNEVILFFGNSLTAGYGLSEGELGFPEIIQKKIDSLDLPYEVVNAGLSGETTAGGKGRIDWILNQQVDIFILELGGNDGLRGIPVSEPKKNLQEIIDKVRAKDPDIQIILAGMQIPPNFGQDYTSNFKNIYPELAEENDLPLIPFLLENVAGIRELNQSDGIHPTAEGQKILAENVWAILSEIIQKEQTEEFAE